MDRAYASSYRTLYQKHWWWRARECAVLAELRRGPRRGKRESILDIGCGDGLLFDRLQEFGDVDGIEIDASLVSPQGRWRDQIYIGPFDESFRPSHRYSLILMLDVLEHLSDPIAALRHASSLLQPSGRLLITVPAFRALWTNHDELNHHYTRYTTQSMRRLVKLAGMEIRRMRYLFHWTCPVKLAIRLKEAVWPTAPAPPRVPPVAVNWACYGLSRFEQLVLSHVALPFGSSLIAVLEPVYSYGNGDHGSAGKSRECELAVNASSNASSSSSLGQFANTPSAGLVTASDAGSDGG